MNGMPRTVKNWLTLAVLMLDDIAIVLFVWLLLKILGISLPAPLTISLASLWILFAFFRTKAVIHTMDKKQTTGAGKMIGLEGTVVTPLTPEGTIKVRGEYWKATSFDDNIGSGEKVEVVGMEGLRLLVKKKAE
jgi:membrane-bound ClpP family serine protease